MLTNIRRLYEISDFELKNPTMNKQMINILYDLSIELLLRYDLTPNHRIRYVASNYSKNTDNTIDLISALSEERNNPQRHDSRYRMGFRSIFVLISDNINKIHKNELQDILNKLKPFFENYSHKHLVNHYVQ